MTGEAPLVDTRNARKQTVVSSDLLNVLPSSVKNLNNLVALTPGFRGNEGFDVTGAYTGQIGGTYHGKGGTNVQFDGMGIQHASGNQGYNANAETVQELVMSTSGISADSNADGAIVNMIPKEGGNTFTGGATGLYSGKSLHERQPERRADCPRPQERQPRSTTSTMRASRWAARSRKTGCGSSARSANGATSGRPPTSSTTRRSTRRSTRRISAGRRSPRSGTSPRPCG